MENIKPVQLTKEESLLRQWEQKLREIRISNARAEVVRKQTVEAYQILEGVRFDYLGDTAFRDKYTRAKRALESALDDFLLSTAYWEKTMKIHQKMTPEEYNKETRQDCCKQG